MTIKRRLKYANGKVAIYDIDTDAPDDAPFTEPADNVSRLHFHSDLPSPAIIKIGGSHSTTGTVNLPQVNLGNARRATYQLFAHGRAGTPLVFGRVLIDGSVMAPLNGSLPLNLTGNTGASIFHSRWVHLGANETHVNLREFSLAASGLGSVLSPMQLDWEVFVTNVLLDGTPDPASDTVALRITPLLMTAGQGKFDSRNRYIRVANSGALLNMAQGKTAEPRPPTSGTALGVSMRYNLDGFTKSFGPNSGSHTTSFTPMKF